LHNKEITYSFITPLKNSILPMDLLSSFKAIIDPLIKALNDIQIDAVFKPVNDIIVNKKKISGSAQTRKHGVLLQHGTILTEIEKDIFEGCLKFDSIKLKEKGAAEPFDLVTSLKTLTGNEYSQDSPGRLIESIIDNYRKIFKIEIKEDRLTDKEINAADNYMKNIFENRKWNFKR